MNPGGEPERDDTGLPPVDIEIPDDARELDRDLQAYHREQRARRRQQRGRRLHGSLAKEGIILPLLACCLILALITGTLLTVFTATSGPLLSTPGAGLAPDVVPGALPPAAATITVARHVEQAREVPRPAALILVPPQCDCTAALSWLITGVISVNARPYLLYTTGDRAAVAALYSSLITGQQKRTRLALASAGVPGAVPSSLPRGGLTAILLGPTRVYYATGFTAQNEQTALIQSLTR